MNNKPNPKRVAVAIIERDGRILIGKRKRGKRHSKNWELPGGTVENGETYEECLRRELQEEFGVAAHVGEFVCSAEYTYGPDFTIRLSAYRASLASGDLKLNDHDETRWIRLDEFPGYLHDELSTRIFETLTSAGR